MLRNYNIRGLCNVQQQECAGVRSKSVKKRANTAWNNAQKGQYCGYSVKKSPLMQKKFPNYFAIHIFAVTLWRFLSKQLFYYLIKSQNEKVSFNACCCIQHVFLRLR